MKSIRAYARLSIRRGADGQKVPYGVACLHPYGSPNPFSEWADGGDWTRYPSDDIRALIADAVDDVNPPLEGDGYTVPIIAMYDIPYTLAAAWETLATAYRLVPTAKAPSDVYCIKLMDGNRHAATLLDLRHLSPLGLQGMADTVGMQQDGTTERDLKIMQAYVERTRRAGNLVAEDGGDLLGDRVMTLTSLARHDVHRHIGCLEYDRKVRRTGGTERRSLLQDYRIDAAREAPRTYEQYAMRRACMRGGFAFVAAREAGVVHGRTVALDETSAYHAQVACRWVPEGFQTVDGDWLADAAERIVSLSREQVLAAYHMPFLTYFHGEFEFRNIRLRPGTVFYRQGIGLESMGRFATAEVVEGIDNAAAEEADKAVRAAGYRDMQGGAEFAFDKLMRADRLTCWITEVELWCMSRVYVWDDMRGIRGEATVNRKRPDDLAVLTSMRFWRDKQATKEKLARMAPGLDRDRLQAIYDNETKPQFNAIGYGLHARDEYRPEWKIDKDGNWVMGAVISEEDFARRAPARPKAWFTYGMRIAAGARMHLIIAMELIFAELGDDARIVYGDTDSLKIRTDVPVGRIIKALEPLHRATRRAIDRTTDRARKLWPGSYDPMEGVGEFVAEDGGVWSRFYAATIKACLALDWDEETERVTRSKLTLAGVPRNGATSYDAWLEQMVDAFSPACLPLVMGWDVELAPEVAQQAQVDYATASASQLPGVRFLGYRLNSLDDVGNRATVAWLRGHGVQVILDPTARACWDPRGAVFYHRDGRLESWNWRQ